MRVTRRKAAGGPSAAVTARPSILDVGRRTRTIPTPLRRALEARDRGCRFPGCGLRYTDGHHIEHWADGGETKLSNLALLCTRHHTRVHEGGWRVCSDATGEQIVFFTPAGRALAAAPPLPALSLRDLLAESTDRTTADPAGPAIADQSDPTLAPDGVDPPATDPAAPSTSGRASAATPAVSDRTPPPVEGSSLADALIARNVARGIRPDWRTNLPSCRHDHEIPWEVEAAAREAIDSDDADDVA